MYLGGKGGFPCSHRIRFGRFPVESHDIIGSASALSPNQKHQVRVQTDAAMDPRTRNGLIVFLTLTFGLSAIFYFWSFSGVPLAQVAPPLMWTPGVAAIVSQLVFHRTLVGLGWRLGPWRYLLLAMLVPIAYCLVIYVPVWVTGLGGFDRACLGKVLPFVPIAMAQSLLTALGEEIGWRGFLAPTLYRASAAPSVCLSTRRRQPGTW